MPEPINTLTRAIGERGDLAHLALLMWALGASYLLAKAQRDLASATRRFNTFVREIAKLNRKLND